MLLLVAIKQAQSALQTTVQKFLYSIFKTSFIKIDITSLKIQRLNYLCQLTNRAVKSEFVWMGSRLEDW